MCEKTDVRVKSCRRQVYDFILFKFEKPFGHFIKFVLKFDNLKRIMRVTEDMKGPQVKSIIENFHLPNKMAE